ncbi:MAG: branched-chain amino acid transaminase [Deltaproteobacteria bacterium]|nr:branched-chain amino acid transaminase [Deltaproteobacteria bacterium]
MGTTYHRGEFVDDRDALLSIRSKALNYGLGCFAGIRAYWSEKESQLFVFRLRDHVERLVDSARILGLETPIGHDAIAEAIVELLRRNEARADHYVRPLLWVDSDELSPTLTDVPVSLSIYCLPLGKYFSGETIHACISSWRRVPDNAIPARAKPTAAYLNSALARADAKRSGYDEAILLTEDGAVSEGSAAHLFLVRRGELISPPSTADNLEGITRRSLIELARSAPFTWPFVERKVGRTELYTADEVFLCGTAAEVTPVARIDHRTIGTGRTGEWTQSIAARFREVARGGDAAWSRWRTPVYR